MSTNLHELIASLVPMVRAVPDLVVTNESGRPNGYSVRDEYEGVAHGLTEDQAATLLAMCDHAAAGRGRPSVRPVTERILPTQQ